MIVCQMPKPLGDWGMGYRLEQAPPLVRCNRSLKPHGGQPSGVVLVILSGVTDAFRLAVRTRLKGLDPEDLILREAQRRQEVAERLGEGRLAHEHEAFARYAREALAQPIQELGIPKTILGEDSHLHPGRALGGLVCLELST
ncbi:hypothetical protein D3C78_972690 [compost metagenome]